MKNDSDRVKSDPFTGREQTQYPSPPHKNNPIGQRRSFGVGFGKRVYVSDICPETNEVRLSSDDAAVWRESFRVRGVNWLVPPEGEIVCGVRIRHSRRELPTGTVTPDGDGAIVRFPAPVRAPTPGQTAAFSVPAVGVVTKIDCAGPREIAQAEELLHLTGVERIFRVSVVTGEGMEELLAFLNGSN